MNKETNLGILICLFLMFSSFIYGQNDCLSYTSKLAKTFQIQTIEKKNYYGYGGKYLIDAIFNEDCQLVEIKVMPKSWKIEISEDDEQKNLSFEEYKSLLEKINQIRSIGSFSFADKIGVTSNSKSWLRDHYQEAFIDKSMLFIPENTVTIVQVHSFTILYKHILKGKVTDKINGSDSFRKRSSIQVNDRWYEFNPNDIGKVNIGEEGVFEVFGLPIEIVPASKNDILKLLEEWGLPMNY